MIKNKEKYHFLEEKMTLFLWCLVTKYYAFIS